MATSLEYVVCSPDVQEIEILDAIRSGAPWRAVGDVIYNALLSCCWIGNEYDWRAITDAIRQRWPKADMVQPIRKYAARRLRQRFPELSIQVRKQW